MKHLKTILVLAICVLALGACKKDKKESLESTFSAKVSGSTQTSTVSPTAMLMDANTLQIMGQFSSSTGISIMITEPKVGSFDIAGDQALVVYLPSNSPGSGYMGEEGTVTITEFSDSRVKGTFEFTGKLMGSEETISVTEGKFDVKLSKM